MNIPKKIAEKLGELVDSANSKREAFVWGILASVLYMTGFLLYYLIF